MGALSFKFSKDDAFIPILSTILLKKILYAYHNRNRPNKQSIWIESGGIYFFYFFFTTLLLCILYGTFLLTWYT